MKLVEAFLTRNPCYRVGKKIKVKGIMLHSVGCPQPRASVFIGNWNQESFDDACVHAFIDGNEGTVYQTLPWDHRGWHCASGKKGSGNNTHIGVEMCEPDCIKYVGGATFVCSDVEAARVVVKRTYEAAVELFAYLCKKYGLDPLADGVVISHKEGYARGIASNHVDPEHLWRQLGLEYTMDGFRRDVKAAMGAGGVGENVEEKADAYVGVPDPEGVYAKEKDSAEHGPAESLGDYPEKLTNGYYYVRKVWEDEKSQKGAYKVLKNAKACADRNVGYAVYDGDGNVVYGTGEKRPEDVVDPGDGTVAGEKKVAYQVRVRIPDLNIRKGPGMNYEKTGKFTGVGVFSIVAEAAGEGAEKWGKLRSGAGWISLEYGERV